MQVSQSMLILDTDWSVTAQWAHECGPRPPGTKGPRVQFGMLNNATSTLWSSGFCHKAADDQHFWRTKDMWHGKCRHLKLEKMSFSWPWGGSASIYSHLLSCKVSCKVWPRVSSRSVPGVITDSFCPLCCYTMCFLAACIKLLRKVAPYWRHCLNTLRTLCPGHFSAPHCYSLKDRWQAQNLYAYYCGYGCVIK